MLSNISLIMNTKVFSMNETKNVCSELMCQRQSKQIVWFNFLSTPYKRSLVMVVGRRGIYMFNRIIVSVCLYVCLSISVPVRLWVYLKAWCPCNGCNVLLCTLITLYMKMCPWNFCLQFTGFSFCIWTYLCF